MLLVGVLARLVPVAVPAAGPVLVVAVMPRIVMRQVVNSLRAPEDLVVEVVGSEAATKAAVAREEIVPL